MDAACVFCHRSAGQIGPHQKLYEDEQVLAYLVGSPLSEGHSRVIPKAHYARLEELPPELAAACARILPALARAVLEAVGAEGCNLLQNNGRVGGQRVDHVHFHLIPRRPDDDLGYRWGPEQELDEARAARLREAIVSRLGSGTAS